MKISSKENNNQIYEKLPSRELLIDDLQYQKDTISIPNLVKLLDLITRSDYSQDYASKQFMKKKKRKIQRRI